MCSGMEMWSGSAAQTGNKDDMFLICFFFFMCLSIYSLAAECDIFGVRQASLRHKPLITWDSHTHQRPSDGPTNEKEKNSAVVSH